MFWKLSALFMPLKFGEMSGEYICGGCLVTQHFIQLTFDGTLVPGSILRMVPKMAGHKRMIKMMHLYFIEVFYPAIADKDLNTYKNETYYPYDPDDILARDARKAVRMLLNPQLDLVKKLKSQIKQRYCRIFDYELRSDEMLQERIAIAGKLLKLLHDLRQIADKIIAFHDLYTCSSIDVIVRFERLPGPNNAHDKAFNFFIELQNSVVKKLQDVDQDIEKISLTSQASQMITTDEDPVISSLEHDTHDFVFKPLDEDDPFESCKQTLGADELTYFIRYVKSLHAVNALGFSKYVTDADSANNVTCSFAPTN